MYNCIILGSGRSGTSMAAGLLAKSGYFMGRNLIPPRAANPKGFFETEQINRQINEALMKGVCPSMLPGHGWLQALPINTKIKKNNETAKKIKHMVMQKPFCYKDPRFCYTLPVWKPFLKKTKFICVFRHPASTATSIVKECNTAKYLRNINMTLDRAFKIYVATYGHVLRKLKTKRDWIFVHYNQLFEICFLDKIKEFLDLPVIDYAFPERKFIKKVPSVVCPKNAYLIYDELNNLALS